MPQVRAAGCVVRHEGRIAVIHRPRYDDWSLPKGKLDQKNIQSIARIQLRVLEDRLAKMDMKLEVTSRALGQLAKEGFDPVFGARPLKRAIQRDIENPLSTLILEGRFGPNDVIPVDYEDGRFSFDRVVH